MGLNSDKCIVCNRPLEASEIMGPVCRSKTLTSQFGSMYSELTPDESHKKAELLLKGDGNTIIQEYFNTNGNDPAEYLAKVNAYRLGLDNSSEVIGFEYEKFKKAELELIKKESQKYRPAVEKLKKIGFNTEDIRGCTSWDSLVRKTLSLNPDLKFDGTEDEFVELYYQALDYLERRDKVATIQLELNPHIKNYKMAKKREPTYQAVYRAGFSDDELLDVYQTLQEIKEVPKTRAKAINYLSSNGKIKAKPKTEAEFKEVISTNYNRIKFALKTARWFLVCSANIAVAVDNAFDPKPKKNKGVFKKVFRKNPVVLFKEYKREQYKYKKSTEAKAKELSRKRLDELKRRESYLQWRSSRDIHLVEINKFWKTVRDSES